MALGFRGLAKITFGETDKGVSSSQIAVQSQRLFAFSDALSCVFEGRLGVTKVSFQARESASVSAPALLAGNIACKLVNAARQRLIVDGLGLVASTYAPKRSQILMPLGATRF
jgi:hypothetical protein